jgi:cholesterol oxidase
VCEEIYDFAIVGSGFGGSVMAMRLSEKGYRVAVIEQGKRFQDPDFAQSTWNIRKFLWLPAIGCFGLLKITPFRHALALHGVGVGGGSLGYANVLIEPSQELFNTPAWRRLANWQDVLRPHYATARRMLGVTVNPCLWPADDALLAIAGELGQAHTFVPASVGVYFGRPGAAAGPPTDPYFAGDGPERQPCIHCGACMLGCRHNAKNSLVKNYLYLAEKWGARVLAELRVRDIRPLPPGQPDAARYELVLRRSTAWLGGRSCSVRARNVVVSAGTIGTLMLLLHCRNVTRSLPRLSPRLGEGVRTNSESILGVVSRSAQVDYSAGITITSSFQADAVTTIQPVRYPSGSDLMRLLSAPLVGPAPAVRRLLAMAGQALGRPLDWLATHLLPGWARRTTILLVMQSADNHLRLRLGRSLLTVWRRGLVSEAEPGSTVPGHIAIGHAVARRMAARTGGIAAGSLSEGLFSIPTTAHLLGGCSFGRNGEDGVVGLDCQVHNYRGLYVVDGSIIPANPGVNPSLTIAAFAEYAASLVPPVPGRARTPM